MRFKHSAKKKKNLSKLQTTSTELYIGKVNKIRIEYPNYWLGEKIKKRVFKRTEFYKKLRAAQQFLVPSINQGEGSTHWIRLLGEEIFGGVDQTLYL